MSNEVRDKMYQQLFGNSRAQQATGERLRGAQEEVDRLSDALAANHERLRACAKCADLENRSHQTVYFECGCVFRQEGLDAEPLLSVHCAGNGKQRQSAALTDRAAASLGTLDAHGLEWVIEEEFPWVRTEQVVLIPKIFPTDDTFYFVRHPAKAVPSWNVFDTPQEAALAVIKRNEKAIRNLNADSERLQEWINKLDAATQAKGERG